MITINDAQFKTYWVEPGYYLTNGKTKIGKFKRKGDVNKFINLLIGDELYCDSCKKYIPKQKISLWQDYVTGRLYNTCPVCNNIVI